MLTPIPSFNIAPEAKGIIKEACFEGAAYAEYLSRRQVPDQEISNLELSIDAELMPFGSVEGVYIPRDQNDPDSRHIIGFSPKLMPRGFAKQGKLLRHESEHFVYQLEHPNHLRNTKNTVIGCMALGAVIGGTDGLLMGTEISKDWPAYGEIPLVAIGTIGASAVGAFFGLATSIAGRHIFGPSELKAVWASHSRKSDLPDGILQVEFV